MSLTHINFAQEFQALPAHSTGKRTWLRAGPREKASSWARRHWGTMEKSSDTGIRNAHRHLCVFESRCERDVRGFSSRELWEGTQEPVPRSFFSKDYRDFPTSPLAQCETIDVLQPLTPNHVSNVLENGRSIMLATLKHASSITNHDSYMLMLETY